MPLQSGASREAFEHNVKTEIAAGRSQKQALAIAYSKQRGDSLSQIARDALLPGPIALPDEDVAEHAAIHQAIESTGIRPDSWQLVDADFYSIYEQDGRWYLNAGGSVRGPYQTRQEAVMAKKTQDGNRDRKYSGGDSLSAIARDALSRDARGDKVELTVSREVQSRGARFHGSVMVYRGGRVMESELKVAPESGPLFKTAEEVQRLLLPYARKKARELGVEITNRKTGGDALSDLVERATSGLREQTGDAKFSVDQRVKVTLSSSSFSGEIGRVSGVNESSVRPITVDFKSGSGTFKESDLVAA